MVSTAIKVLLFEDNPADELLLRDALGKEALGKDALDVYSLTAVKRLAEGLSLLEQAPFDLALLDLGLPDCRGLETFERLHRAAPDLPVVVLSGNDDEQEAVQAVRLGAQDYLVKSRTGWELAGRAIRYAVLRQQAQDELRQERQKLAQIAATVPGVIHSFLQRPDGTLCMPYASPAIEQVYGVRLEDVAQDFSLVMDHIHPQDIGHVMETIAESARSLQPWHDEFRYQHPMKGEIWIEGHSMPARQPDGGYLWHGFVMDVTAYRQAELDIRQGAEKLRLVFESTRDILFMVDREYRLVMSNQAYQDALRASGGQGMAPGDLVLSSDYPLEISDLWRRQYERALAGEAFEIEIEQPWDDGVHHIENNLTPVCGAEGAVEGVLVVARDITERWRAQQELQESENRFRQLANSLPQLVWTSQPDGRCDFVSQQYLEYTGVSETELLGARWLEQIHPDDRLGAQAAWQAALEMGIYPPLEFRLRRWDGAYCWFDTRAVPVYNAEDRLLRWVGSLTDITAIKAVQAELQEFNRTLEQRVQERTAEVRDLYENAPCGYHSLDAWGCVVHINATELKWLGFSSEEVLGRPYLDFITPETRPIFHLNFPRLIQRGWVDELELDLIRKDGSRFPILVNASAIYDEAGSYLMSRSTVFDITERKRAEQALRQQSEDLSTANAALEKAARLKDEFLASMSHELRTPLTGVLGLAEALQFNTYGELNPRQLKALKNIEISGRHLLDLINDILDLSKIEAGRLDLHIDACALVDICQASLQLTRGMAQQKRQKVNYSMNPALIMLRADPRRLKQMLVNLLSNAVKFSPQGGELGLEVQGSENEQVVHLSVWDKGIGIPPEDFPRLFKPFVQLDSSLSRQHSGTGLGLSLVQRLAEMHGGSVQVESTPGQGSRFTITLPWFPPFDAPSVSFAPPAVAWSTGSRGGAAPRVLVADDNEVVLSTLADFLQAQGCRVTAARSGKELLDLAAADRPQVLLVDIQMPGMDGLEVMRRLRTHPDPDVAGALIIAITALAMPGDRQRCLDAGANEYMSKPLRLPYLLETIYRLLALHPRAPGG